VPVGKVWAKVYSPLFFRDQSGERRAIGRALVLQLIGKRDSLTVVVQRHQHVHVLLRSGEPELHAVNQAVEHMRRVEFAIHQLVAHRRPRRFLGRDDLDAVLLVEFLHRRHHHRRAVGERNEADPHFLFLRRIGTGGPGGGTKDRPAHQRCAGRQGSPAAQKVPPPAGIAPGGIVVMAHLSISEVEKQKRRLLR
jgi:hypothetical protein